MDGREPRGPAQKLPADWTRCLLVLDVLSSPAAALLRSPSLNSQVTAKAGDLVLAHYQIAHSIAPNSSPHIRYVVYFRVHAKSHPPNTFHASAMTDIWQDWAGMRPLVEEARRAGTLHVPISWAEPTDAADALAGRMAAMGAHRPKSAREWGRYAWAAWGRRPGARKKAVAVHFQAPPWELGRHPGPPLQAANGDELRSCARTLPPPAHSVVPLSPERFAAIAAATNPLYDRERWAESRDGMRALSDARPDDFMLSLKAAASMALSDMEFKARNRSARAPRSYALQ